MTALPFPPVSAADLVRLPKVERRQGTIGRTVFHLAEVDSTNRLMGDLARDGALPGTVVVADHQVAGRGKGERPWFSRPGEGLCLSILLSPKRPIEEVPQVTLVIAVAVAEAIIQATGVQPRVKWPNDLLVDGRKLCGILCELISSADGDVHHVIAGIGLNIGLSVDDFPGSLQAIGTSLAIESGRAIDRFAVLPVLLDHLEAWVERWEREGFAPVRDAWVRLSCTLGKDITLESEGTRCHGVAVDLGIDGSLSIRDESGEVHHFHYGETRLSSAIAG
ncbi:biotin--[acetyl-CoA-carboxylase] ligase [Rhodospirillum rubrum]|uniref:biotin--[acetyl-CoA-carboxylase] ligase n=1 Tax=Rhodospirillum rubrum TaxID=1085 RepID=UPI0019089207|nr:biotin--[acetyl-CoA-carboxylase] ligase [Rhodospirillum rubrum]MBK1662989.1 biotin--[acetyl-CoA-carboxylase] ligase [Rhodospirillum rubrum]MBK1675276.1 biotin--[acetyl-CoA-carboxylase] ligase [Rhodospirillum rubrum]